MPKIIGAAADAIAAARKAIEEGEAIVAAARQDYRIVRSRPGKLARAFKPAPRPEPVGPDYFLSDREQDFARAAVTMLRLARVMRRRSAPYYKAAGQYLEWLRRHRDKDEWLEIVRHEAGLGPSRAYELTALARGERSIAEARQRGRERTKKSRAKSKAAKKKGQRNQ